jgi:hypothetical protein
MLRRTTAQVPPGNDDKETVVSEYLGVLQQLSGLSKFPRVLAIYDDAMVVARGSSGAALGRAVAGSIGAELGKRGDKAKAEGRASGSDPEALAGEHDENELIRVSDVAAATFKKTKLGLYRELTLTMKDGSVKSVSWQPGHNKDKVTRPLLQRALGNLLES